MFKQAINDHIFDNADTDADVVADVVDHDHDYNQDDDFGDGDDDSASSTSDDEDDESIETFDFLSFNNVSQLFLGDFCCLGIVI